MTHDFPADPPARRVGLPLVLTLALLLRLGWGLTRPTDAASIEQLPDQREYLELARNLLEGRGLVLYDPRIGDTMRAYRTPGYPLFLALFRASPRAARVGQTFIDTSTALAIYLLARRWLSASAATLAAAFVAFNPYLIYFSGLLLSDTLFTAAIAWGMLLLQRNALLGGLTLALAILIRPSGIALPMVLGVSSAILNRQRRGAYPRWWPVPPATTLLILTILVLLPWAYRNDRVLGRWVWVTTNGGITLYDGLNPDATGASNQGFVKRIPGLGPAGELRRNEYFTDEAWGWASRHPRQVIELAGAKIARTWSPVPLSAEFGRPLYRLVGGLWALPFDLLVIAGLCYGRLPRSAKVFLLLPAIYFTAVHALTVGSLRYRLPAEPPMAIMAVAGCQLLVASGKARYRLADSCGDPDAPSLATGN